MSAVYHDIEYVNAVTYYFYMGFILMNIDLNPIQQVVIGNINYYSFSYDSILVANNDLYIAFYTINNFWATDGLGD